MSRRINQRIQQKILRCYRNGKSGTKIARDIGYSPSAVYNVLKRHGEKIKDPSKALGTEVRIWVGDIPRRFSSIRCAAQALGMSAWGFIMRFRRGGFSTWPTYKFREHPGLDAMPTPYPFQSKSREVQERQSRPRRSGYKTTEK